MKKQLDTASVTNELKGASRFFQPSQPETEQEPAQKTEQVREQPVEQVSTDVSKSMSRSMSKPTPQPVSSEAIELLHFRLRKTPKVKVNTQVPLAWKAQLDDLAHQLGVGKYDLVLYMIGQFLGQLPTAITDDEPTDNPKQPAAGGSS